MTFAPASFASVIAIEILSRHILNFDLHLPAVDLNDMALVTMLGHRLV